MNGVEVVPHLANRDEEVHVHVEVVLHLASRDEEVHVHVEVILHFASIYEEVDVHIWKSCCILPSQMRRSQGINVPCVPLLLHGEHDVGNQQECSVGTSFPLVECHTSDQVKEGLKKIVKYCLLIMSGIYYHATLRLIQLIRENFIVL